MNTAHIPLKPAHNAALNSASPNNFLRGIIERDLAAGTHATIVTRFPPEPNGFLHIGHAKSICLNFGLAKDFGGVCHLRFDDTNPEKESQVFADSIMDGVQWLTGKTVGASTNTKPAVTKPAAIDATTPLFFASDYFDAMHACAVYLLEQGLAYVDEQTPEQTKQNRGTLTQAGMDSPFRGRSVTDNLTRFAQMRAGEHAEGSMVLRAKIDMASPNMNMRDPAIYRIRHVAHHRTGAAWCIYPM